ncbi:MAG: CPBP family glutamic-type intramembrane protease [Gemmataceae bacterium]
MEQGQESDAPAVRWGGGEVGLALLMSYLGPAIASTLLTGIGWFRWYYGEALDEALTAGGDAGYLASARMSLWSAALGILLQVAWLVTHLAVVLGVPLEELGLTTRRLGRNLVGGLVFALVFAPGAYGLQALAVLAMRYGLGVEEQAHIFTQLGKEGLWPAEWVVLVCMAVVLAPIWEELVYRGVVQPWVMDRQPKGGWIALGLAFLLALAGRLEYLQAGFEKGSAALGIELIPFLALLACVGVYLGLERRRPDMAGLFATAVLFAWIHARVWPSPVSLLWLALGLGWLRWKSGSLVGSIVLHAVFNAVACAVLLASVLGRG